MLLSLRAISKSFGAVRAVRDVDFEACAGRITALVGENGAGKSTVISLASGAASPDSGQIVLADGQPLDRLTPAQARSAGVAAIRQEPVLVGALSVAENLALGATPSRVGLVDRREVRRRASAWLTDVGADIDPQRSVAALSPAERQLVEVARSVGAGARVLFFDEPTAVLGPRETGRLFSLIRRLADTGAAIVYVSHRLEEIFELCHEAVVMRDGAVVEHRPIERFDERSLVQAMAGRELLELDATSARRSPGRDAGRVLLDLRGVGCEGRLRDVDLRLHAGEVHGIAGIVGAGRSRLVRLIAGVQRHDAGSMLLDGDHYAPRSVRHAIDRGVCIVPEDRLRDALFADLPQSTNVVFSRINRIASAGLLRRSVEADAATPLLERLDVRPCAPHLRGGALSGGNQQKLIVARALFAGAHVLLLDEPSRGVDVSAKADIHRLVRELAEDGAAVLLVSSDMRELMALSDRITVLARGRVAGSFAAPFDAEQLLGAATSAGPATSQETQ